MAQLNEAIMNGELTRKRIVPGERQPTEALFCKSCRPADRSFQQQLGIVPHHNVVRRSSDNLD